MALHVASGSALVVLLVAMAASLAHADFHIVYWPTGPLGPTVLVKQLVLVPSNDMSCSSVANRNHWISKGSDYPSCHGGDILIPNNPCGWTGAKIRPDCGGTYFGKLLGGSNEPVGDCFWSDTGFNAIFGPCCNGKETCNFNRVYDRLTCFSAMCGRVNHAETN